MIHVLTRYRLCWVRMPSHLMRFVGAPALAAALEGRPRPRLGEPSGAPPASPAPWAAAGSF